ncbi:MAG: PadR family transcriptional regulator [Patescibacteria group bacterium]
MRKFCSHVVVENFFEPCVLFLLMQKPSYGYELMKELTEKCTCSVNVANLYRGLARLENSKKVKKKKIKGDVGPAKVVYEITDDGKKLLAEWIEELEENNNTINKLIQNYNRLKG